MFLYDKKEKTIDIYSFEADKNALIEYRKKLMEGQNIDKLFYSFETTNETIKDRFFKGDELDIGFLEHEDTSRNASDWWSKLNQEKAHSKSKQIIYEELLNGYINGEFSQVIPTRTFTPDGGVDCYLESFLVTKKATAIYSNIEKRKYYRLEDIINLPKELCVLQLLENGRFSQILGSWLNFDDQLELFKAQQAGSVSDDEMKNMFAFGLLNGTYEDVIRKVEPTQKILERMKKR